MRFRPSTFKLVAEKDGFQTKVLDNLHIIPEQPNAIDVKLEIGQVAQTVTVDASQAPLLDTDTADHRRNHFREPDPAHAVVRARRIPVDDAGPGDHGRCSRRPGAAAPALPGTQGPGGPGANTGIFATENGPQTLANGGQYENNSISIDGISTTSVVWGGTSVITPSEESVDNVRVVSNGYDAENGRFSGAQIEVTSKSGTNQVHGSAFFQAYRPGLNAYQRYNGPGFYHFICQNPDGSDRPCTPSERGLLRDSQQFNQMGGSVGGPLWKIACSHSSPTRRNEITPRSRRQVGMTPAPLTGWRHRAASRQSF